MQATPPDEPTGESNATQPAGEPGSAQPAGEPGTAPPADEPGTAPPADEPGPAPPAGEPAPSTPEAHLPPPPPPIPPVDVDGVRTVLAGTILFAVGFVVTLLLRDVLAETGREWWPWTCLAGAGLGLLGYEYTKHRRDSLAEHRQPPLHDADRGQADLR